ncbi:cytochrome P450, partial [Epithele typhae]|uniref:cytochrome P450 n=1 Tax=Epithele typhae TaxID=378194 RepID=UPI0020074B49
PPGPHGLPLVGNVSDIPAFDQFPWLKYDMLSRNYDTDVLRLSAFGRNLIVLSSLEAATELLDKRSSIYSDRPRMIMVNELSGFGWTFGSIDANEDWRVCRKMAHTDFHATPVKKYRHVLTKHAHNLVHRLDAERGKRLQMHLRHMVGANIMQIVYAIDVLPENDPFIKLAEAAQECISRAVAGTYLVDLMPLLRYVPAWFPGAQFQRDAAIWRQAAEKQLNVTFDDYLRRANEGFSGECTVKAIREKFGEDTETERCARMTAASMYIAGSETVAATLHTFFLAMLLHPEVLARARQELEAAIGTTRLPSFDDIDAVPYLDAVVMEVIRWQPAVPMVIPHKLCADDTYKGYHLEKGSVVTVNVWAILHDAKTYPHPDAFDPSRFLAPSGAVDPCVPDPFIVFGFGRRVCPGQHMALDALWVTVATVVACLDVRPAPGVRIEDVRAEFVSGFVVEPKEFPCEIRFRSATHAALLD